MHEDVPVFLSVLEDTFPTMELPKRLSVRLEQDTRVVAAKRGLQPQEHFMVKVSQLDDLLRVRHCVFVIGPPRSAKTQVLGFWSFVASRMRVIGWHAKDLLTAKTESLVWIVFKDCACVHT